MRTRVLNMPSALFLSYKWDDFQRYEKYSSELFGRLNLEVCRKEGGRSHWDLDAICGHSPRLRALERQSGEYLSGGEQQMLAIARTL